MIFEQKLARETRVVVIQMDEAVQAASVGTLDSRAATSA